MIKNNPLKFILIFFLVILIGFPDSKADIGLGVSPPKMSLTAEGGKTLEKNIMFYNTGDSPLEVEILVEGELADFVEVIPKKEIIKPEPQPHQLPIKNGKTFLIRFKPSATFKEKTYTGKITAVGRPPVGAQFGGNVAITSQVTLKITKTKTFLSYITLTHIILIAIFIFLVVLLIIFKRSGLKIKIEKEKTVMENSEQKTI